MRILGDTSILFDPGSLDEVTVVPREPEFFRDLNLDQIVSRFCFGRQEYGLEPWFYTLLRSVQAVHYRHDVFVDLQSAPMRDALTGVAESLRVMRRRMDLSRQLRHRRQRRAAWLESVEEYARALRAIAELLDLHEFRSSALRRFRGFVAEYVASEEFLMLEDDARRVGDMLSTVRYCVQLRGNRIGVSAFGHEGDYSLEVEDTFSRFHESAVGSHLVRFAETVELNHVEAGILDLVAEVQPEPFAALDAFCEAHPRFLRPEIVLFDREVQFYLGVIEHIVGLEASGLAFSLPVIAESVKAVYARSTFDLALAFRLAANPEQVVCNDISLSGPERVIVVTGANQGGKTTFARSFGQLNLLAALGLPVPAAEANLPLCDRVFTHFETREDPSQQSGGLEDELFRVRAILERATERSVVILNEIFTSVTVADALALSRDVISRLISCDGLCVCVTFIDELASIGDGVVSMVAGVDPRDPRLHTFRVTRRLADGVAHAVSIAEHYRLTFAQLSERINS
jgi:DNA mismatch repair protein MutS